MKRHVIGMMNSCKEVEIKIIIYYLSIASIITGLVFAMNMHLQVKLAFHPQNDYINNVRN
jgi:hypothetical protein